MQLFGLLSPPKHLPRAYPSFLPHCSMGDDGRPPIDRAANRAEYAAHLHKVTQEECDENGHLSARDLTVALEEAAEAFCDQVGVNRNPAHPRSSIMRFRAEALAGAQLAICSRLVCWHNLSLGLGQMVSDAETGRVLTVALHVGGWRQSRKPATLNGVPDARFVALARGFGNLTAGKLLAASISDAESSGGLSTGGLMPTPQNVNLYASVGDAGRVGLFGEGTAAAWAAMGLTCDVLKANNWGRMVAKLVFDVMSPQRVSSALQQRSEIISTESRVVRMAHYHTNEDGGNILARASASGFLVDLDSRKPVRLPEFIRQAKSI